jgi:hypothetical protein
MKKVRESGFCKNHRGKSRDPKCRYR